MTRGSDFVKSAKCSHGHRSAMSNSAWCDLNKNCTVLNILLLSLTDPDILKQSKFTDDEINIIKDIALSKLHRQRILKEHIAMDLLEKQFSD